MARRGQAGEPPQVRSVSATAARASRRREPPAEVAAAELDGPARLFGARGQERVERAQPVDHARGGPARRPPGGRPRARGPASSPTATGPAGARAVASSPYSSSSWPASPGTGSVRSSRWRRRSKSGSSTQNGRAPNPSGATTFWVARGTRPRRGPDGQGDVVERDRPTPTAGSSTTIFSVWSGVSASSMCQRTASFPDMRSTVSPPRRDRARASATRGPTRASARSAPR